MDIGDHGGDLSGRFGDEDQQQPKRPRALPDDLPKSLDDRKNVSSHYTAETEMYDAWQGMHIPPWYLERGFETWLTKYYSQGSHNS